MSVFSLTQGYAPNPDQDNAAGADEVMNGENKSKTRIDHERQRA